MAKAFVVGACIPNGGTFMAYQLGRIMQSEFDYQPVAVRVGEETWDRTKHNYSEEFPVVSIAEMEATITSQDVLVVNPSFSRFMFGLRLPGLKICYVQGCSTFAVLDARFDHYVASSSHVQTILRDTYGITAPVISPFLEPTDMITPPRWAERPDRSAFVYLKGNIASLFFDRLRQLVGERVNFAKVVSAMSLPRETLLKEVGSCRFLVTLSPVEGFGLVPLEAMSLGTVVVGFDGFGGRDYLRPMENCAVSSYPHIEQVAASLLDIVDNPSRAEALAAAGRNTASQYSYNRFHNAWTSYLTDAAGLRPRSCILV